MLASVAVRITPNVLEMPPLYIWNASDSVPIGLHRLRPADNLSVTQLVAIRPPDSLATFLDLYGYLPARAMMLKRVLALPGQTLCRNGLMLSVDAIDMGEARDRSGRGRAAPELSGLPRRRRGRNLVKNWQSANSLEGRYFGFLPASAIVGRARPGWTSEN